MTVSPTLFRRSALTRRRLGAALSAVALVALSAGWVGGGSANAAPLPAGLTLSPVLDAGTGLPICDALDESPDYADIACNTTDNASAYFGGDGTVLGAGFVIEQTPVVGTNQAPFSSTAYVVQLGVGGVWTASIGIDAKGTNDTDYVYAGCAGAAAPTYTLLLSTALLDQTVTVAPDSGGFTRVTFNVPLSALAACGITSNTALAPFFGTSQAGPLDNINKDFFIGKKVDFGVVATPVVPQAPSLTQSQCVRGAASTPTYDVTAVTGVIYKVGGVVKSGAGNPGVAGTTMVLTAEADTAKGYVLKAGAPTSFDMVFTAAPTNCSPTAVAPTLTQSVCVGNTASVPTYTVNAVTGVIYSVGGVVKTGAGNPGVAGTTIVLNAAADTAKGFALDPASPTSFNMVFAAAPNCAPVIIIPVPSLSPSPSPSPSPSASPSPSPAPVDQDLGISKTGLEASVVPGDVLSWSVSVTNVKGTPASAFTVTDVLADGLTLLTAGGADWSCTNAGQTITCAYSGAPLAVGSSSAFQIDSLVGFDYAGSTVSNTAVVDPGGVDSGNDSSTVVTPVIFTGGGGGTVVEPTPSPAPTEGGGEALPFTGSYTDKTLTAGVALLVLGLFLALGGRRRRTN